jgi:UDP-3-O-[3-hydroxymyristoyl] glucosamine N-acyltransferase
MKPKVIIFGVGSFAKMVAESFDAFGAGTVVAHCVHQRFMPGEQLGSLPVVPFETLAQQFDPAEHEIFVALEHARQNAARAEILDQAKQMGYRPASLISPSALLSTDVELGEHCLVLENVVIQFGAKVGRNNFFLANGFIGQGSQVGDHNYFGSAFFADRHSSLGSYCTFGSQVRVAESIRVHDWSFIKPFQDVTESLVCPTLIHPVLRAPGRVIDRRSPEA